MTSHSTQDTAAPRIVLQTDHPVALHSPDHLCPWGTRYDNSVNLRFNEKLEALYPRSATETMQVLDLGCSGGGFVKSILDRGGLGVGLEGSDYSLRHRRAEWRTIPEFLFTCDITKPFALELDQQGERTPLRFHVITAWEVMEHIAERELPPLIANVKRHLRPDGLWIISVASTDDIVNGVNLHQTVKPRDWWIRLCSEHGLTAIPAFESYFNTQYVRGPKYGAPSSFHLVLSASPADAPRVPRPRLLERVYDRWLGSARQRRIARWIMGPASA